MLGLRKWNGPVGTAEGLKEPQAERGASVMLMDFDSEEPTPDLPSTTAACMPEPPSPSHRRFICSHCSRPGPVCLCHVLPSHPIHTTTRLVILHHPHEAQHKLSTTPILTKALLNATAIVGRRLHPGLSALLDQYPKALYLFPPTHSSPAVNINHLKTLDWFRNNGEDLVLIVFDGTWKHAREMVKASEEFLSKFATRVCLEIDEKVSGGSIYDSELILRKEPFAGCVSTMEAVARALRVIEPNGSEIESKLIEILREMVKLQASYLKPMKPRPKLMNKVKEREKQMEKNESSV